MVVHIRLLMEVMADHNGLFFEFLVSHCSKELSLWQQKTLFGGQNYVREKSSKGFNLFGCTT
jgi:hypothetical protein